MGRASTSAEQARLKARQGVANLVGLPVRVVDEHGADVPADGDALGEIVLRGNNVMLGYYRDPEATAERRVDGWFRTGDLGVVHPDGYVELRDRSKDVIISGGENIASIEVEQALGEPPGRAGVRGRGGARREVGRGAGRVRRRCDRAPRRPRTELVEHVRARLARFKAPKRVVFGELPKTGTGKIQKFVLRDELWADRDDRIGRL